MLNKIILMGRLTRDPELRRTQSGTAVTSFSWAVDRDFKSQSGEKETDFIDIVAWRNTAEFVSKYIDKILVTPEDGGSLRLDIKIFTGETTQKYLANLRSRTGHTFKKMIEAYEQGMQ